MNPFGVALARRCLLLAGCAEATVESERPTTAPAATSTTSRSPHLRASAVADARTEVRQIPKFDGRRQWPTCATWPAHRAAAGHRTGVPRAARWVEGRFSRARVRRHASDISRPAGSSWGVPVAAGRSANVIATPAGFDPAAPYYVVGAHLDTVAVAPGAEDNASGIAVLLETARLARAARRPRSSSWPSAARSPAGRATCTTGAPSVRRRDDARTDGACAPWSRSTGSASATPLTSAGRRDPPRRPRRTRRGRRRLGVRTVDRDQPRQRPRVVRRRGLPAARIGSTPYAGYHSAQDVPAVVGRAQLHRTGRGALVLAQRPSPLNRQKFANIRSAAAYGTTRGAWSGPIR